MTRQARLVSREIGCLEVNGAAWQRKPPDMILDLRGELVEAREAWGNRTLLHDEMSLTVCWFGIGVKLAR